MVQVDFTVGKFPWAGSAKDDCGLPLGLTLQPFAKVPSLQRGRDSLQKAASIPRCSDCYSYLNCYCPLDQWGWTCAICGIYNAHSETAKRRYANITQDRLPEELKLNLLEVECDAPVADDEDEAPWSPQANLPSESCPIYIMLVDTCSSDDFLEEIKNALATALEALPPYALFGLLSFDDRVSLYDVKGAVPSQKKIAVLDSGPLLCPLGDIIPLQRLLAPVGDCKECILKAFEGLRANAPGKDNNTDPSITPRRPIVGSPYECRGQSFGPTIQAVLQYLQGLDGPKADDPSLHLAAKSKRPVRVISFLGGPPSLGQGSLMDYLAKTKMLRSTRPERNKPTSPTSAEMEMGFAVGVDDVAETAQEPGMKKATSLASAFYEEASLVATSLGVSIDVFVISKAPVGLDVLSTIANNTGGGVWLYPSVQDAMLTQDLYRHLSSPHAQNCLLKVRTSPEFRVARLYGRVFKDPMYDDVYHMMSCDAFDVVTVDFEFVHKEGFGNPPAAVPTVQVAFQYTTVTADGQEPKLQRRMRICTIQAQVARNPVEIFNSANAESIICMLLHKVLAATEKEGKQQAALLLQDWLVILAASYDKLTHRHGEGQLHEQGQPFVPFEDCEALQAVPRLVYGLLRSPLMLGGQVGPLAHPDLPTFLRHQWTSLPPSHLHRAMYPQLSSYSSASAQSLPSHSLSVAAVTGTEAPIFLLDALTTVLVYYKRSCPPDLPFPPPPNSLLRTTVNDLRQNRRMAPKYKAVRQGEDDAQLFEGRLIDEPLEAGKKLEGEAAAAFTGYFHFLEWLRGAAATLGSQEAE